MIALNGISIQFGGEYLFRDIDLRIGDRERIAVVGSNGAGKSTLMKIIAGIVEPEKGAVVKSRTTTVGYLPQDGVHNVGKSLYDEAATAFDDILELHDRAEAVRLEISRRAAHPGHDPAELQNLAEELGEVMIHIEHKEGYNIETRVKNVLSGLGFREGDFGRRTDEFSGGWQMRIELAKLLLREPTILLLDEPTNHLDIEALEWLEEYLRGYEGSVIIVSHDSRFLDNMVGKTIEISLGKMYAYAGNYSFYLDAKEARLQQVEAEYENQQQKIRETKRFIERFRYKATKARQVQSRIRMLEKMERIELEDEEDSIEFRFPPPSPSGRIAMELRDLDKRYGDLEVFRGLRMTIERGDRIAFLGANGAGKSTLARIIAGIEPLTGGERQPGYNVRISYYAQHQAEELDPRKTVLETLDDIAAGEIRKRLRTLLGCFLFSGDEVFKRVSVLSGGERSRLALAKMLLTPANLLILDEPTNHLDIRSKAVLQEALRNFEGSFVIVSHDRDFLEPIINKVAEFRGGGVRLLLGSVSDYLRKRHAAAGAPEPDDLSRLPRAAGDTRSDKERKRAEAEARQKKFKRLKPLKDANGRIEKSIAQEERKKLELESLLADAEVYKEGERARQLNAGYKETTARLEQLYREWEDLQWKMDAIEREEE